MSWLDAFFRAYWFSLMFWTQLSIGALLVLLLQYLTGGEWGKTAVPYLRAIASGFFLCLPLFLPPLFALSHIFSWTKIEVGISSPVLVNKQIWLNPIAFTIRTLVYLGALALLIALRHRRTFIAWSGPFFVLGIALISLCSTDWMMSLQPTFYSSLYPFLYFAGAMTSIFAVIAGGAAWLQMTGRRPDNPKLLLDYGTLLFSAIFFWGYIVFSQFIIIWTGNLPDEAEWYIVRSEPAWLWLTLLVLAGHFAIPFCLLLSQRLKKNARQLFAVALLIFLMHFLEVFWMTRPTPHEGFTATIFDLLLPLLMGAAWLGFVFRRLSRELALPMEARRES